MQNEESSKSKLFWKSGVGVLLKAGGVVGALTTVIAFIVQMASYVDTRKNDKIKDIVKEYYRLDSLEQCPQMAALFTAQIEDFYGQSNYNTDSVINSCRKYRNKWAYYHNNPDYESFKVSKINDTDFFVTFHLLYKTKKHLSDTWKRFDLTMNIELTKDYKIKSIYEEKSK